ncbi:MAG TPA: hypothetical protein VFP68_12425 [Burkholderiaceae bacterium]|nr:hypothetical protein [Burkholderiaceae bacterium]
MNITEGTLGGEPKYESAIVLRRTKRASAMAFVRRLLTVRHLPVRCLLGAMQILSVGAVHGQGQADLDEAAPYKLTIGQYRYGHGFNGEDANLRWRHHDTSLWIGEYHDKSLGSQTRVGADTIVSLGSNVSLQPSLQAATRGFLGGSITFQVGEPWFVIAGWGRTNLKPYFNLNFDPNDALTIGGGWHSERGSVFTTTLIADDRLGTGQKHLHFTGRWPLQNDLRLTLDLLHKTGLGDDGRVRAWGFGGTLDFPHWSLRIARDPKQNFSTVSATRVSAALRF